MMLDDEMLVGSYIRKIRKNKGVSLNVLSETSSISKGYLSQIENNKFIPSPEVLKKIAIGLESDYFDLMAAAGHFTAEDAAYRKKISAESLQNVKKLNEEMEALRQQMSNDPNHLKLELRLLPGSTNVYLDGRVLNDDEKQQLLNVARAMFSK